MVAKNRDDLLAPIEPIEPIELIVAEHEAGQRVDQLLTERQPDRSRSQIKQHITAGCCRVDDVVVERPSRRLKAGERVSYHPPPPEPDEVEPEAIPLSVLHEDAALIVIDKAAGMVVHPAAGHRHGTLVGALLHHCRGRLSGVGGRLRPGIVHRLDRLTSGVMVATKTDRAHRGLGEQFAEHSIERRYLALVVGQPPERGTFDTLHGRHPTDRKRFTSRCERGRRAVTHYEVVERLTGAALVEARLETGRTHQVRVHFADARHPLVGDPQYGRPPVDLALRQAGNRLGRQALHAHVLGFTHPESGRRLRFVSPLPEDMRRLVGALGGAAGAGAADE